MHPDRLLYEEMARRGSRGRWFLRAGIWLSNAGLLGIALLLVLWPVNLYFKLGDAGFLFWLALMLAASLFVAGNLLKRIAYRMALSEGMNLAAFFARKGDGTD
ncbi:MAG: hypothetical protein M0011_01275 [Elusimicrobia bacterium]|nr:hypothetical protein [Elusimicrobiota bacterium]